MIAQRTPHTDGKPNGDGWLGQPHPFNADLAAALSQLWADREAWRKWSLVWRRAAIAGWAAFGLMALVAVLLFVALGAR